MLDNFKFIILTIVVLILIGFLGFWAFTTLEPGDLHALRQEKQVLEDKNRELEKEVTRLQNELGTIEAEKDALAEAVAPKPEEEKPTTPPPTTTTTTYKNQTLINELQKLITDNIFMKEGSKGTRVGTVQKFLNLYNKTSTKVDNDYGPAMKTAVTAFQKAVGITADGETGPTTYKKMIDWLKKQG